MDTQTEVPTFKLAKVGKERKRKGGGATWWSGGSRGSGFMGLGGAEAGGGIGGFAGAGMSLGKAALLLALAAVAGAGAWTIGRLTSGDDAANASKKIFADKGASKYDDLSGVIKTDNSIPNSLGYVSGSLDGLTPEERAKKLAEEEAARKAAEDAAKKQAEADAAKQADAAAAPVDARAAGAANGGSAFASRFGKFGSSLGGLSGGSGLSGGIGRGFNSLGGNGGLGDKGKNGAMTAFNKTATPGQGKATPRVPGAGKGFAFSQLRNTNAASRTAAASPTAEGAASGTSAPFDGMNKGGNSIDGPGVGNGVQGAGIGNGSPLNPGSSGGGGGCPGGQYMGSSGSCQSTPGGGTADATPYAGLLQIAQGLMMAVMVLCGIALLMQSTPWTKTFSLIFCGLITLCGLALAGIGAMIATKYGNMITGGIIGVVGAWTMLTGAIGFYNATQLAKGETLTANVPILASVLIGNALAALASSSMSKPPAATQ